MISNVFIIEDPIRSTHNGDCCPAMYKYKLQNICPMTTLHVQPVRGHESDLIVVLD